MERYAKEGVRLGTKPLFEGRSGGLKRWAHLTLGSAGFALLVSACSGETIPLPVAPASSYTETPSIPTPSVMAELIPQLTLIPTETAVPVFAPSPSPSSRAEIKLSPTPAEDQVEKRKNDILKLQKLFAENVKGAPNRDRVIEILDHLLSNNSDKSAISFLNYHEQLLLENSAYLAVGSDTLNYYQGQLKFFVDTSSGEVEKVELPAKDLDRLKIKFSGRFSNLKIDQLRQLMIKVFGTDIVEDLIHVDDLGQALYTRVIDQERSVEYSVSSQGRVLIKPVENKRTTIANH